MNTSSSFLDLLYEDLTKFPDKDPRTDNWMFMQNPEVVVIICVIYFFLTWKGPQWMEHRKPFEFPLLLTVYNVVLVGLSVYISYEVVWTSFLEKYTLTGCQPVNYEVAPLPMRMANIIWWYFFTKIIELLDSIFFILRKKNQQLTFLHVYHHGTMPIVTWIASRYLPGGAKVVACALNSSVHIIMYSYYALSALGPGIQKYLWWKKYITRLQMLQFVCIILHSLRALFVFPCTFPKLVNLWLVVYPGTFLLLFANFYRNAYDKKDARRKHIE